MSGEVASSSAELRDVGGPSALGGGWRRFWNLLWLMSVTEFRRTYLMKKPTRVRRDGFEVSTLGLGIKRTEGER